jgi:O-antigen/teichoic acid export membrane protein
MVFRRMFDKLFKSSKLQFVIVRYGTTAAIAIELLIYARLLGPESFGNYALAVQIVGFLLLVGAGSGAGYVYVYFKNKDPNLEYIYLFGSTIQYLGGALFLSIFAWFSGSYLFISSLLLLLQIPYLISEPMLRVRNQFTLSAIGRSSGSMATIAVTLVFLLFSDSQTIWRNHLDLKTGIGLMLLGNSIGYSIYYYKIWTSGQINIDLRKLLQIAVIPGSWLRYWQEIISPYWLYIVSSILFVAFTYVDRLFLQAYYPKLNLSVYSLAWQIAQSVLLLLNSLNVISGVKIGESQAQDPKVLVDTINKQLKFSMLAGVTSFCFAILASSILNFTYYKDYIDLVAVSTILSTGYLAYGVVGSVTMSLFFERKFTEMIIAYSSALSISIIGNILSIKLGWSYLVPISISTFGLIFSNLFVWQQIQKNNNKLLLNSTVSSQ